MTKSSCVEKALLYIEENLKREVSLEDIADAANYSQWYFHRVFKVLTGHCVNDYLRRRRLCEASHELLYTRKAIRVIAKEYQFDSQEAFTRSFSSICGISPGRYRKQIAPLIRFPAISLDNSFRHLKKGAETMKPRFVTKEAFTVVGVYCTASPSDTLHKLWEEFGKRVSEIEDICEPTKAYQVCVYNPKDPSSESYTFIAGMSVKEADRVPEGMMAHHLKGGEYAVFEHHGTLETLHQSYQYIFGVWLSENSLIVAEADSLEVYDERFKVGQQDSVFEIWIPVVRS